MISKSIFRVALIAAAVVASNVAFAADDAVAPAKKSGTKQNHHCKQADGTMDMTKTHKACVAAKGSWEKDGASAAAAPATSAAPKK